MPFKSYSFVLAAVVLTAFLAREQSRGTFRGVSETYRGWLTANSDGGTAATLPAGAVFLSLSESERDAFEGWPLTRLDYAVLAQNLARFNPRVLAVQPPLAWDAEDEFTAGVLREQLRNLPATVLGYPLATGADSDATAVLPDRVPAIAALKGNPESLPPAHLAGPLPEAAVVPPHASLGFTGGSGVSNAPLLARVGGRVPPSLSLQTAVAGLGRDTSDLQATLGSRVRIRGAGSASIPIDAQGHPAPAAVEIAADQVIRLQAGTLLLTGQPDVVLANLPPDQRAALDALKDAVVVLGYEDSEDSAAKTAATATAIIARFSTAPAPPVVEYLLWALLILAGAAIMRCRRRRVVFYVIALAVAFTAGGLIAFQSTHRWVSPTIPLALIAAALAWGLAVPHRKKTGPEEKNG